MQDPSRRRETTFTGNGIKGTELGREHEDMVNNNIDFLYKYYCFIIFDQYFALWDIFNY